VQLEQLAGVVLVDAGAAGRLAVRPRWGLRARRDALHVVEIEEHRGAARGGEQQVLETSERVRADHVLDVARQQEAIRSLVDEHVEVIEPEAGHDLAQLVLGGHGARDHERANLVQQLARLAALFARHARPSRLAHGHEPARPLVRVQRQRRRAPLERREARVVDVRVKLRVQPRERALARDRLDLPRTREPYAKR
jgi:hypothetical protein